MLAAVSGSTFLFIGVQMIYPVLLPDLRTAYDLDLTTAGLLITLLWTMNAVFQLPGGFLTDRFGERTIMAASAVVAAGTILLVVSAGSAVVLYVATGLLGVTVAINTMARFGALTKYYPDQLGAANGATLAAADAGQAVLPPFASILAAAVAWQLGLGFAVPLFLLVAVWLWVALPPEQSKQAASEKTGPVSSDGASSEPTPEEKDWRGTLRAVFATIAKPPVRYGTAVLVIYFTLWILFTGFYPTYLIEEKELTTTVASSLFGLFFAVGIVVKPIAGNAYDRIGLKRTVPVLVGVPGVAIALLPLLEGPAWFVLATIVIAPVLGSGTVVMSYLLEQFPDDIRGTGFGTVRTLTLLVGGLSPLVFGAAADRGFFDEGMVFLGALALAIIPLTVLIPRSS